MADKNELKLQTEIVHSVRQAGGYSRKLTNRFTIGIPDLVIMLYPFIPCMAEVKDLGQVNDTFSRKLDVSEKQRYELERIDSVYWDNGSVYGPKRRASLLLVGAAMGRRRMICALPWNGDRVTEKALWIDRQVGGLYDIRALLDAADIAQVRVM